MPKAARRAAIFLGGNLRLWKAYPRGVGGPLAALNGSNLITGFLAEGNPMYTIKALDIEKGHSGNCNSNSLKNAGFFYRMHAIVLAMDPTSICHSAVYNTSQIYLFNCRRFATVSISP